MFIHIISIASKTGVFLEWKLLVRGNNVSLFTTAILQSETDEVIKYLQPLRDKILKKRKLYG